MVIVLDPTFRFIAPLALPLGTFVPFTVIDAFADIVVGVTFIEPTEFAALAVYCRVAALNAGVNVPADSWRFDNVAIGSGATFARVAVTVYVVDPDELLTTIVIVLEPTFRLTVMLPTVTVVPFIVIDAFADVVVGVTVTEVIEFATLTVYCRVAALKTGVSVPVESWRFDKVGIGSGVGIKLSRVTVAVYVVDPAELLTTIVITLDPTFRFIAPLALPLATFAPFTVIVAVAVVVGVTVTEVTEFTTFAVYCRVVALNVGDNTPADSWRFDKVGIGSGVTLSRVTITV